MSISQVRKQNSWAGEMAIKGEIQEKNDNKNKPPNAPSAAGSSTVKNKNQVDLCEF